MPSTRQRHGAWAENIAAVFLESRGFHILGRHLTSRYGEIDILADDNGTIVAVEVKARRNKKFGRAIEAVTADKIQKIEAVLEEYCVRRNWTKRPIRIDVVTVEPEGIDHLRGVSADS